MKNKLFGRATGFTLLMLFIHGNQLFSKPLADHPPLSGDLTPSPLPPYLKAFKKTPVIEQDPRDYEIVSDIDTQITGYLMQCQYPEDPFLIEFLKTIRKDIRVWIMTQNQEMTDELWENMEKAGVQKRRNRIRFFINENKPIKKWARDPFVVLRNNKNGRFTLIPAYPNDSFGPNWISDQISNYEITAATIVKNTFSTVDSWILEGGMITAGDQFAFIGSDTISLMLKYSHQNPPLTRENILANISEIVSKKIFVIPAADSHSDRYHMPIGRTKYGEQTSLLADPLELLKILSSLTSEEKKAALEKILNVRKTYRDKRFIKTIQGKEEVEWIGTWLDPISVEGFMSMKPAEIEKIKNSAYVQALNATEDGLKKHGITVVRIPALSHSYNYQLKLQKNGKTVLQDKEYFFSFGLFYINVIQDSFQGHRSVIIPKYGIDKLDQIVYEKYESLKCFKKIHQISSLIEGTQGGGPRCRVQVLGIPAPKAALIEEQKKN